MEDVFKYYEKYVAEFNIMKNGVSIKLDQITLRIDVF